MKAIINGRIYNTDTADLVTEWGYGWSGDFYWHETALYRTKKGIFFLAGEGGPRSMWADHEGGDSNSGSGLILISMDEARSRMEAAGCTEEQFKAVGLSLLPG